jgi:hypothetical protein
MKKLITLTFILFSIGLYAQVDKSEEFLKSSLSSDWADTEEIIEQIDKYDFSTIFLFGEYNYDLVIRGYIGSNYQRLQIHLISVVKNPENSREYFVYGKSKVNRNICEFLGTIELMTARFYKESDIDTIKQGFVIAKYKLNENQNQKHTGIFTGYLKSNWYIDNGGRIMYDDLSTIADGYKNNEFVGVWKNYNGKSVKTCNWAHGRIPYSRELDTGAGEFYPDEKYRENGWVEYMEEYDKFVKNREENKWWK